MGQGRRTNALELVKGLEGSAEAKEKLRVILENLLLEKDIPRAAEALGVSVQRYYQLRAQGLQAALEGLEPRPIGRPPDEEPPEEKRVKELEAEVATLRLELKASEVREVLALVMPNHRKQGGAEEKKR